MNETRKQIGIIVVDDHPIVAAGIRSVVEDCAALRVLGQASSGHEAIELCIAHHPDVLLLDLRLPDLPGAEVCRRVKTLCPNTRVLILTSYGDDANVMTAIASGADGYLLKHSAGPNITEALIQVARGGQVLDPAVTGAVMRQATGEEKQAPQKLALSELDLTILRLLSTGLRNKEIGPAVGLSEKTVRNHLSHIFATLGVQTRTEAAVLYGKMSSSKSDGSV